RLVLPGPAHAAWPALPGAAGVVQPPLPGTVGVAAALKVERDGRLSVTETVLVPEGREVSREIRLRQPIGNDLDRVFDLADASVDNGGTLTEDGDTATVRFRAGTTTLRYVVAGTVADVGDRQEVRWTVSAGWDTDVDTITVTFVAPRPSSSVTCFAGPVGSSTACTLSQITDTQLTGAREVGLRRGERMELAVGIPQGTVPADLRLVETFSLARAFRLTPLTGAVLAALLLALLGGLGLLWRLRGRDEQALQGADGTYDPLVRDGDRVLFASPEGVLPGQIGTVVDEHVDVVDVTATVVDLAVRNYLWLAEDPADPANWLLVRRNPPDEALRPYERAVYDALLGDHDQVSVRDLSLAAGLTTVRDAMYSDVVASGWFARRPDTERSRASLAGLLLAGAGVVATVVLAAFTTMALLGPAVVVAGVALTLGARHLPARTARGSGLLAQLVVLRRYLHTTTAGALPEADRELVFSRSLPYAVVLGETDRWLATFADLDPAADGTPGLYWYGSGEEQDLRAFAGRFRAFVAAMDGVLAEANHLRAMRPA
ncbi:MAG TPA: DUF2207 domain-containing protein, partial [Pseudonocardiaceae bacterium]